MTVHRGMKYQEVLIKKRKEKMEKQKVAAQNNVENMSGEALAELITQQFQLLMQTQNNIAVIQNELAKRKTNKVKE